MKPIKIILFIYAYTLIGCNNVKTLPLSTIVVAVEDAKEIDLSENNLSIDRKTFTLDDSDDCLIANIEDIIVYDSLFIIRTHGRIVKFDYEGRFCGNISMMGRAGNEYIGLNAFWKNGDTLYLYDMNGKKVLLYTIENELINTFNLSSDASSNPFAILTPYCKGFVGKKLFVGSGNTISYELAYYNNSFLFEHNIGKTELSSGLNFGCPFFLYNNLLLYWRQLGNYIYSIDDSFTFSMRYYVDFGKKNVPVSQDQLKTEIDIIHFVNNSPKDRYATMLTNVVESDKYVLFCFISNGNQYLVIYDKILTITKVFYFVDNDQIISVRPISEEKIMIFSFGNTNNGIVNVLNVDEFMSL
jgi:hypothetical protein